jgi:hypothetical protein
MPWSEATRARQSARIREWKPWEKSTGPLTEDGKSQSSRNANKGACRPKVREIAKLLRRLGA